MPAIEQTMQRVWGLVQLVNSGLTDLTLFPEERREARAGDQTAKYIENITLRLTLLGSIYLVVVCFVPNFLIAWKNVPFYFGGTSLLIIVVVTMDFMTQVQAYVMSQQYESLLKKANFKGGLPTR